MECEYCGAELEDEGPYGKYFGTQYEIIYGYIYRCPNSDGFDAEEEANSYYPQHLDFIDDLEEEPIDWEEIVCDSNCHSVSGSFYSDTNGNIYQGYPC